MHCAEHCATQRWLKSDVHFIILGLIKGTSEVCSDLTWSDHERFKVKFECYFYHTYRKRCNMYIDCNLNFIISTLIWGTFYHKYKRKLIFITEKKFNSYISFRIIHVYFCYKEEKKIVWLTFLFNRISLLTLFMKQEVFVEVWLRFFNKWHTWWVI